MWVVLWEFRVRYDYNLLGQLEKSSESTQAFLGLQNSVLKGRLRQGPQEGWSQRRRRNSTWMMATVKKTDNTGKRGVWWTEIKKKHLQSMSTWVLRESGGCLTQGRTAKIQTVLEVRRKTGEKTCQQTVGTATSAECRKQKSGVRRPRGYAGYIFPLGPVLPALVSQPGTSWQATPSREVGNSSSHSWDPSILLRFLCSCPHPQPPVWVAASWTICVLPHTTGPTIFVFSKLTVQRPPAFGKLMGYLPTPFPQKQSPLYLGQGRIRVGTWPGVFRRCPRAEPTVTKWPYSSQNSVAILQR